MKNFHSPIPKVILLLVSLLAVASPCLNNSYAQDSTGTCQICSFFMLYCSQCSNNQTCTTCGGPYLVSLSVPSTCQTCSTLFPNCSTCSNNSCTSCQTNFVLDLTASTPCLSCNSMIGCLTCTNLTSCIACNTSYLLNATNTCNSCSSFIPDCDVCYSTVACHTCMYNAYLLANNTCAKCNTKMSNCVSCSNNMTCTQCILSYVVNASLSSQCVVCNVAFPQCLQCSGSSCISCQSGYGFNNVSVCTSCTTLINSICLQCFNASICKQCLVGYTSQGGASCTFCFGFTSNCYECNQTTTVCISCLIGYYLIPNKTCLSCNSVQIGCTDCTSTVCLTCSSAYALNSSHCVSCSAFMSGCQTCQSSKVSCSSCSSNTLAIDYTSTPDQCRPCSAWLDNCTACINSDRCIRCLNSPTIYLQQYGRLNNNQGLTWLNYAGGYYKYNVILIGTIYGRCVPCNSTYGQCVTCNTIRCLSCVIQANITLFNNTLCKYCKDVILRCLTCRSQFYCLTCSQNSAIVPQNSTHQSCIYCPNAMANCLTCTNYKTCTSCSVGSPVIGGCSPIPGCAMVTQLGNSQSICLSCDASQFIGGLINNKCECLKGHLAGWYCVNISGCITANQDASGRYCLACSIGNNFRLENRTCVCKDNFYLENELCVEICGDGRLINLGCDDGNRVNGDGCSSNCQVQENYICSGGSSTSASTCVFKGRIFFILESISAVPDSNLILVSFRIEPPTMSLSKLNMTAAINFTTQSNVSLSKTTTSFDHVLVYLQFFQKLKGNEAKIQINFDPLIIKAPQVIIEFHLKPTNGDGFQYDPQAGKSLPGIGKITLAAEYLSYACLGVFFVSSLSFRMIGVETVHVFQWVAVALIFSRRYNSYFHHFASLLATLGRSAFLDSAATLSPRTYFAALGFSDSLSADFLLLGIFLLLSTFFFAVLSAWNYFRETQNRATKWIYDIAVFPLTVGFSANGFMTLSNRGFASSEINCAFLFAMISVSALVFARSIRPIFLSLPKLSGKEKLKNIFHVPDAQLESFECTDAYIGAYVSFEGVWLLLVGLGLFSVISMELQAGGLLTLIRMLLLLCRGSYASLLHRFGLLLNHTTVLFAYIWLIVQQKLQLTISDRLILTYTLFGLLSGVLLFSLLRTANIVYIRFFVEKVQNSQTIQAVAMMVTKTIAQDKQSLIPLFGIKKPAKTAQTSKVKKKGNRDQYRSILSQISHRKNNDADTQ